VRSIAYPPSRIRSNLLAPAFVDRSHDLMDIRQREASPATSCHCRTIHAPALARAMVRTWRSIHFRFQPKHGPTCGKRVDEIRRSMASEYAIDWVSARSFSANAAPGKWSLEAAAPTPARGDSPPPAALGRALHHRHSRRIELGDHPSITLKSTRAHRARNPAAYYLERCRRCLRR